MLDLITLGLAALATTSGRPFKEKTNFAINEDNVSLVNEICEKNETNIKSVSDVYSLSGINEFAYFELNNGEFVVIDKVLNNVVESGLVSDSVYKVIHDNDFIIKNEDEHFYYDYVSNKLICFETNEFLQSGDVQYKTLEHYGFEECTSVVNPYATWIDNYYYFDKLNRSYGDNDCDICGIIASQILLGYYDTFYNDNIIDESFDVDGYRNFSTQNLGFQSPSSDGNNVTSPRNNVFRNYLIEKSIEYNGETPVNSGMTDAQVRKLITKYLEFRGVSVATTYFTGYNSYIDNIENFIDNNKPVIATLPNHFVVVYGYDDDYFYVDSGWTSPDRGGTGRMPKSEFVYSSTTRMVFDISIQTHVHSNNYFDNLTCYLHCGCGYHHSNRLNMSPSDWGFAEQYFFYSISTNHQKDNISFQTSCLRTGYIQSSVINLSPRRQNAGHASFQIKFPKVIYELRIELAWWSDCELQSSGDAYFNYHRFGDIDSNWVYYYQDFHQLNLPLGYQNRALKRFIFDDVIDGIWFDLTNLAVGNTNKGRLSIGYMTIDYYY